MRIVIDLQGAQAASRNRGIGRYSLAHAQSIVRNRGEHEVLIALNGQFPETIEPIRAAFDNLLPQENIRVWHAPAPVAMLDSSNVWQRQAAELIREAFLASLKPDIVHVSSLFEGLVDDAVTSIGSLTQGIPTAVTLYDLIPFIHRDAYLRDPNFESWYFNKLDHLRRADLWLAISESTRIEGIKYLNLPDDQIVNISSAADEHFRIIEVSDEKARVLLEKNRLNRPFVMYTGGIDQRKNVEALIRAFARLPADLRSTHQLAIVCSIESEQRKALELLARQHGLKKDQVVFTGFIPEEDLVLLYNLCKLFVFPSWHEGFGLPALEAMRCGAPVIGSNTSSLTEVISIKAALFDPYSEDSISAKIAQALSDDAFRDQLIKHGTLQADKFSWDITAKRSIDAFEAINKRQTSPIANLARRRPKLAYISPLPPEHSGIADYSAELLPELARHYDIEVIVNQKVVSEPAVTACFPRRSPEWFLTHATRFDRVLYHFGNSIFHEHMFTLLEKVPGVVVLHDFFLSGIQAHREIHGLAPYAWRDALYDSHGYAAVKERFHTPDLAEVVFKYPCNINVLRQARGVIVHSNYSHTLAQEWYGKESDDEWITIPLLRSARAPITRDEARLALGIHEEDFVTCSFGVLGPTKQNHRLLKAWLASHLAENHRCKLFFVGESNGDHRNEIHKIIQERGLTDRIIITGWVDKSTYTRYLAAADMAVQLRTLSRGETSAAVLDCMNYGLPTIVNAHGSMVDLPKDAVWMLPDNFEDADLIQALESLWSQDELRKNLGARAHDIVDTQHRPRPCADRYQAAIEYFYANAQPYLQTLVQGIANLDEPPSHDRGWIQAATAIAQNMPLKKSARQLLVDISELVQGDSETGIQRVVRAILNQLIKNPLPGYRTEPIYATLDKPGYRYARKFTLGFIDCPNEGVADDLIEAREGDIFLGLNLQPHIVPAQSSDLMTLKRKGVQVHFVVYDLLPINLPHTFPRGADIDHLNWLRTITQFDGAICISHAVADELALWMANHAPCRQHRFRISQFHLGADIKNSVPSEGLPDYAKTLLAKIKARPSFLMVGTLEPRKGHAFTLSAFETLWNEGMDINLVIVGKQGWMIDELANKLRHHPERDKRLFWLDGVSDELLDQVYTASSCLIAASEGEGFGLPLIEAAQHKIPIIARDIPVFREVAGAHALYFDGLSPDHLSQVVKEFLYLRAINQAPSTEGMHWLTWEQSADQLKLALLNNHQTQTNQTMT